ncbi:hypothetical protein [Labrys monachus]|uniref:Uncharacterized protein n=1 Tax=Labrys monachus TaxID=217067 RepID=A0ABU0F751_9HYPH|nr:hypothetical protein [Labrys monachus]MDQ0390439.1 hypothetical protein [Labrys monachus]
MVDDSKRPLMRSPPANDNGREPGGEIDAAGPSQRLDRVVLDIARLIGRQMAREDFERLRADNDNQPRSAGTGDGEADED